LKVYGNIVFGNTLSQADLDAFEGLDAEFVRSVEVSNTTRITDLRPLAKMGHIAGWLIQGRTGFTDLSTLPVHDEMMDLLVYDTTDLESVSLPDEANFTLEDAPYERLASPFGVRIERNEALKSVAGFDGVTQVRGVLVSDNDLLERVDGFNGLIEAGRVAIFSHFVLKSITGFGMLQSVDELTFASNLELNELSDLSQVLEFVGKRCVISTNPELSTCLALLICGPFADSLEEGDYSVRDNADDEPCE
jgi:hypothetical protein